MAAGAPGREWSSGFSSCSGNVPVGLGPCEASCHPWARDGGIPALGHCRPLGSLPQPLLPLVSVCPPVGGPGLRRPLPELRTHGSCPLPGTLWTPLGSLLLPSAASTARAPVGSVGLPPSWSPLHPLRCSGQNLGVALPLRTPQDALRRRPQRRSQLQFFLTSAPPTPHTPHPAPCSPPHRPVWSVRSAPGRPGAWSQGRDSCRPPSCFVLCPPDPLGPGLTQAPRHTASCAGPVDLGRRDRLRGAVRVRGPPGAGPQGSGTLSRPALSPGLTLAPRGRGLAPEEEEAALASLCRASWRPGLSAPSGAWVSRCHGVAIAFTPAQTRGSGRRGSSAPEVRRRTRGVGDCAVLFKRGKDFRASLQRSIFW